MGMIIHLPKQFMQAQPPWVPQPSSEQAAILEIADLVSFKRCGVISALLSVEQRELLLAAVGELLADLDAVGRAS